MPVMTLISLHAAKIGPPGKRVTACSAPLRMAFAPALIIALKGWPGGAVTRAALAEAETPVEGPPVPIRVVMCRLLLGETRALIDSRWSPVAKKEQPRSGAP